jgi:hypothetical protein
LHRAGRGGAGEWQEGFVVSRNGQVGEPLGVAAVEVELVDRLGGAPVAQFWWSIRGEDDEGDAAEMRLGHGGQKVGGGGA